MESVLFPTGDKQAPDRVFRLAQEDGHMTGKWEMVAENQMLGFQNYPALTSKKSKVENTTRKTLDTKDCSSLSTIIHYNRKDIA